MLSLLIILNLVSKSSVVRTIFSLSFFAAALFLLFLHGFYCCRRLFSLHRWCSTVGQPSLSCCRWCLFSPTTASTCIACLWFFLPSPCRSFASNGTTHSNYRFFSEHPPSCFVETYEHKLYLLENADEAISPWLRCFSLRWRLSVMSSISYFLQSTRFRQIVGALQYLTFTCPDICFDGNRVCQFMHAPTDSHWAVVKRILRYLRGTTLHGLHITRSSSFALHGFTYAN